MHQFTITLIESSIPSTIAKVKKLITDNGGLFQGDTKSGQFSAKGVSGSYQIFGGQVNITIINKPWYASNSIVESKIRSYFS